MDSESKDVLGLKPYGDALKIATQGAVDGVGAFLGRICLPAAEEFGLFLRDRVAGWRRRNIAAIEQCAAQMYLTEGEPRGHAHPRLVQEVIDKGSWSDAPDVQAMWAGLLVSSCTKDGEDESNLIFLNLLGQLTSLQARVLRLACERAEKVVGRFGLVSAQEIQISISDLRAATEADDLHRLDREIDHLRALDLIDGGILSYEDDAEVRITPSPLALNMYVRCQGSLRPPAQYFGLEREAPSSVDVTP